MVENMPIKTKGQIREDEYMSFCEDTLIMKILENDTGLKPFGLDE